jgi:hypothetical protein
MALVAAKSDAIVVAVGQGDGQRLGLRAVVPAGDSVAPRFLGDKATAGDGRVMEPAMLEVEGGLPFGVLILRCNRAKSP